MELIGSANEAEEMVVAGPSDDISNYGKEFKTSSGAAKYDDSFRTYERDLLCGMYTTTNGELNSMKTITITNLISRARS